MSDSVRSVFDTNVVVSALLFKQGKPSQAFRRGLRQGEILLSPETLEELTEVLHRQKFDRYVPTEIRHEFLEELVVRAALVEPAEKVEACRDPKDDKFLELAISGSANYIVTGDEDLLVLNPFRSIAIVTPDQFLRLTESQEDPARGRAR